MFGIFDWIRRSTRAAFLAGIQDGVNDLTSIEGDAPETPVLRLSFRPAVEPEAAPAKRKKAE